MKQVTVFVDPFEVFQDRLDKKLKHEKNKDAEDEEAKRKREKEDKMGWFGPSVTKEESGVGKYLQAAKRSNEDVDIVEIGVKKQKQKSNAYGNFDNF
jgi:peptidyl-prolyl cis-trans isomerase-like protein 2